MSFKFLHGKLHAYVRMCTFSYMFCILLHLVFITKYIIIKYIYVKITFVYVVAGNLVYCKF